MIDWWAGTVFLAFFPIFVSTLISIFNQSNFNFQRVVGNGELILSAFAVSAPTLINHSYKRTKKNKPLFYGLLFSLFIQLIIYTSIKTNYENSFSFVFIASLLCVTSSVIISWKSEKFFKEANKRQTRNNLNTKSNRD